MRQKLLLAIENKLKKAKSQIKISALKRQLGSAVSSSEFFEALARLRANGKILVNAGKVVWIYRTSIELEKLKQGGLEL